MAKLAHLDGLRGSAAFIVMAHHFSCAFLPAAVFGAAVPTSIGFEKLLYASPLQLLVAGNFAVCIFFVLSGFVLSHKFFQTHDPEVIRSAAVRRYFRLMPPVLASILAAYLALKLGFFYNQQVGPLSGSTIWLSTQWLRLPTLAAAIWQGLYVVFGGNFDTRIYANVLWTMKIEFIGSFLVFAFLALFGQARYRCLVYVVLGALLINTYYVCFVFGLAISDFASSTRSWRAAAWYITLPAGLAGLFLGAVPIPSSTITIFSVIEDHGPLPAGSMMSILHAFGALLVLIALIYSPALKRLFSTRPMRHLGRISFSLYLLHLIVIGTLGSYLFIKLVGHARFSLVIAITFLAVSVVSLLLAEVFTRRIDEPAVRLSTLFYRKLFEMGSPSTVYPAGTSTLGGAKALASHGNLQ